MHELSIAQSILEILNRSVPNEELGNVRTVNMKVGRMAGVVCESLEFSFRALVSGTPLSAASLSIARVPFRIHCSACDRTSPTQHGFALCPHCSGTETRIVSGMELQVVSIDLCEPVLEAS